VKYLPVLFPTKREVDDTEAFAQRVRNHKLPLNEYLRSSCFEDLYDILGIDFAKYVTLLKCIERLRAFNMMRASLFEQN
jgi:hypothetical protein